MLAWPMHLYSGQAPSLVNWHKVKPYPLHLSSLLTLPGVIPPTLVPEAAEVPQSQLWSLGRFNILSFHYTPDFRYIPTTRYICRAAINTPATVPSPKVNPAGTGGNPDGTYSPGSYTGI
jgi:hypothetical protein